MKITAIFFAFYDSKLSLFLKVGKTMESAYPPIPAIMLIETLFLEQKITVIV